MKYVITGEDLNGQSLYWNGINKGWYINKYDATFFDDVNKADTECYIAEQAITVEGVSNVHFIKV